MRPEELVGRAGQEVGSEVREVDRRVGHEVDAVDVGLGPGGVCQVGDRRDVGRRAEEVGGAGERDQPGPVAQDGLDLGRLELAGRRGRSRPSEPWPRPPPRPAPTSARWSRGRAGSRRPRRPGPSPWPGCGRGPSSAGSSSGRRPPRPGPARAGRRSAARAPTTAASALRSAGVVSPRLASGATSTSYIAWATTSGVCEPPGPSKWAAPVAGPSFSCGKWDRTRATSYGTLGTLVRTRRAPAGPSR